MNAIINYIHVLKKNLYHLVNTGYQKDLCVYANRNFSGLVDKRENLEGITCLYAFMTILFLERDANTEGLIYIICCEFELSFKKLKKKIYPQKYHIKNIQDFYDRLIVLFYSHV